MLLLQIGIAGVHNAFHLLMKNLAIISAGWFQPVNTSRRRIRPQLHFAVYKAKTVQVTFAVV